MRKLLFTLLLLFSVSASSSEFVQSYPHNTGKVKEMIKFSFAAGHCNAILIANIKDDKDPGVCVDVLLRYNAMLESLKDV